MGAGFSVTSVSRTATVQRGLCSLPNGLLLSNTLPRPGRVVEFILTIDLTHTDLSVKYTHMDTHSHSCTHRFLPFFLFSFDEVKITPQSKTAHLCNQNSFCSDHCYTLNKRAWKKILWNIAAYEVQS